MKKTIAGIAIAAALAAAELIYPVALVVDEIQDDTAILKTSTGYTYSMPAEDAQVGDLYAALMFDAGEHHKIADDKILAVRFSGWTAVRD